jgi:hypothetical protein
MVETTAIPRMIRRSAPMDAPLAIWIESVGSSDGTDLSSLP